MSGNDYSIFWTEAIRQLMEEGILSEQEHSMWFRNMSVLGVEKQCLLLSVPSNFYRDQVKQRYLEILKEKLNALIGSSLTIEFEIQKKPAEPDPTAQKKKEDGPSKLRESAPKEKAREPHHQLRIDYNFEGFVVGKNNRFAAGAAHAISDKPGGEYNPFLIYGGVGLGKTHLMQAIGNSIHYSIQDKRVVYITAETFINEFIQSIRTKSQNRFKNKYRKIDVLLIDDIHDLQNKTETQEELFHTFDALYDSKKQLVFTCDRPPAELRNFTDRLKSRFERGLTVDLQPPNFETRYAILRKKLETVTTNIPEEVLELIADNVTTNVRDLEASLIKIAAYGDLVGKKITLDVARQQLKGTFAGTASVNITIDRVQRVVSDYFNVTPADMKGKRKTKQVTFPRQVAMYIIREITDYSTTEIGLEFGGRDHTTVMHSYQRIEDRMKGDPTLEPTVANLIRSLKESG